MITEDSRETTYLFQQLPLDFAKGKLGISAVSFQNTLTAGYILLQPVIYLS